MKKLAGCNYTEDQLIQARISDTLSLLLWTKTKDAERGRNRPELLIDRMLGNNDKPKQDFEHDIFETKEDFIKARQEAIERAL